MEVLCSNDAYILVSGENSLWCSRVDGRLKPRRVCSLAELTDPQCLGVIYGIIGKFKPTPESSDYLVVIRNASIVGVLPDKTDVFKINRVALLPLTTENAPPAFGDLDFCRKHHVGSYIAEASPERAGRGSIQRTWNSLKSATSSLQQSAVGVRKTQGVFSVAGGASGIASDKYELRLLDELVKMFEGTESFYFSTKGDLTNTMQRKEVNRKRSSEFVSESIEDEAPKAPWDYYDDRFFWNRAMISELLEHFELTEVLPWVTPVIQGFVQIDRLAIQNDNSADVCLSQENGVWVESNTPAQARLFNMILISRRSRYRAGTRYKRRGVDENGRCANFVETEQMFEYGTHVVSFVLVRGSVPLFWSQPGVKYRPPPRLDRGEDETQLAFQKHFEQQLRLYGKQVVISLVEQCGAEAVISRAYLEHILRLNSPDLTYVAFDFHDFCRGMHFENVAVLINRLKESSLKDAWSYFWVDGHGVVCEQESVFRVNCIDCLDRTNVVHTAIAREIMETQFLRLGLLSPEASLPLSIRRAFQVAWANNGDIISRQYAGTAALKGDYTRTGARKLSGLMKDGYNSANRYYLNRFRDSYRQSTIDIMLGNPVDKEDMAVSPEQHQPEAIVTNVVEAESLLENCQHEHVKQLIEDCKKMLIPDEEVCLGGWALIDADPTTGDASATDMDTIFLLTREAYFVAEYDDLTDRITRFQRVLLEDLEKMEIGPEPSLFKSRHYCLRLHYLVGGQGGYFHMFRCASTRLFNNVAVPIVSEEEAIESLRTICESLKIALSVKSLNVPLFEGKLERRRSKMAFQQAAAAASGAMISSSVVEHLGDTRVIASQSDMASPLPRNISEGQLMNFVGQVGSRAFSSMSSQLSRLNPMKRGQHCSGGASGSMASIAASTTANASYGNHCANQRDGTGVAPPAGRGAFGGSSQAILMTVAEHASEDRTSPEPPAATKDALILDNHCESRSRTAAADRPQAMNLTSADLDRAVSSTDVLPRRERDRVKRVRPYPPTSISIDRPLNSDHSDASDILGAHYEELSQMTDDGLLESCGILASTSCEKKEHHNNTHGALLSKASSGESSGGTAVAMTIKANRPGGCHYVHKASHDVVDDFVLDAMRKTSLQQLKKRHRMSLNASKEALCMATMVPPVYVSVTGSCCGGSLARVGPEDSYQHGSFKLLSRSTDTLDGKPDTTEGPASLAHIPSAHQLNAQQQFDGSHMKASNSESAISPGNALARANRGAQNAGASGSFLRSPTTPIIIKKDLVLSPLSKIAKGVQSLGQSVVSQVKSPSRQQAVGDNVLSAEEIAILTRRKAECQSLIIEI